MSLHAILPGDPAYLVSPPLVVEANLQGGKEDWFVWWQRRSLSQTGGRLLAVSPGRATKEDWRCLYLSAMPAATKIGMENCHVKSTALAIVNVGDLANADDAGFAQLLPAHVGSVDDPNLRLIGLQTRECVASGMSDICLRSVIVNLVEGKCKLQGNPNDPCLQPGSKVPLHRAVPKVADVGGTVETNSYRNFVASPYVLRPRSERAIIAWLRRDGDYKDRSTLNHLVLDEKPGENGVTVGSVSEGSTSLLGLREIDEPLFVVGRNTPTPALVSITREETDRRILKIQRWAIGQAPDGKDGIEPTDLACEQAIDGTWLDRPPVVAALGGGDAIVVLSRAISDENQPLDNASYLQLASIRVYAADRCTSLLKLGPKIAFSTLVPQITASDAKRATAYLQQRRTEIVRQTPILVAGMDGEGPLKIVFPGAGYKMVSKIIGKIDGAQIQAADY